MPRFVWARSRFAAGAVAGTLFLFAARQLINNTPAADWLVAPLLTPDTSGRADAIVVLGAATTAQCGVNNFGVRRVLLGVKLWREGRAPVVVFTGGPPGTDCPVAKAMALLAHEIGLPPTQTVIETQSSSTSENGSLTAPVLHRLGVTRVLIVTDRLHMRRAAGVFRKLGFGLEQVSVPIFEAHADNFSMLWWASREYLAHAYYGYKGWVDWSSPAMEDEQVTVRAKAVATQAGASAPPAYVSGPLVILGASYAGSWPIVFVDGREVLNRGIAGQQTSQMLARFDTDVVAVRPRAVVVWGLVNDFFNSTPEKFASVQKRIRDNYLAMIAKSEEAGIEVVMATEVPMPPPLSWRDWGMSVLGRLLNKESYMDRINREVALANSWIRDTAAEQGLLLLDLERALADPAGRRLPEYTRDDGTHISGPGYEAVTAYAQPRLTARFRRPIS